MTISAWQGTDEEFARLQVAVVRNCECVAGMFGMPPTTCEPHRMLDDQTMLDHLLYVYRTRRLFITREFYALPLETGRRKKRSVS